MSDIYISKLLNHKNERVVESGVSVKLYLTIRVKDLTREIDQMKHVMAEKMKQQVKLSNLDHILLESFFFDNITLTSDGCA